MGQKLSDIVCNYLKYKENIESFSPLSLKAYQSDLKQAFKNKYNVVCDVGDLWTLLRPALTKWGQLSLSSRNRKIATLKSFFKWLYEQKMLDIDYSNQLVCPKVPKKIPHFLSVDEALTLLKYLNSENKTHLTEKTQLKFEQKKILFLLLYGAGLRISEACHLKWEDINISAQKILVTGKGNKERFAILPQLCCEQLKKIKKYSEHEFVFGSIPLNPRKGYELIRELGHDADLMNTLHPHALRHSYATHLLASGTNLRTLQKLLGHESLQATEKYTHLSVDHLARLVERTHPLNKLKLSS